MNQETETEYAMIPTSQDELSVALSEESRSSDDNHSTTISSSSSTSSTASSSMNSQSVLVIRATGKAGTEMVRQLADVDDHPVIYGMTDDIQNVPRESMKLHMKHTEMLIEGNVAAPEDLHRALLISQADTIVLAIDDSIMADARREAANSIVQVLRHPPFRHVRLIVVSFSHAGRREQQQQQHPRQHRNSNNICNFGKVAEAKRQHLVHDHQEQEEILALDHTIQARTTIVRPADFPTTGLASSDVAVTSIGRMSGALEKMQKTLRLKNANAIPQKKRKAFTVAKEVTNLARYLVDEVVTGQNKGLVVNMPRGDLIQ